LDPPPLSEREGGGPMRKNLTGQARYSSTNKQISSETFTLNPWWVTGFSDAEGSFNMSIFKSKTAAIGWTIEPCFIITLNIRDLELLNAIKKFFSVGSVSVAGNMHGLELDPDQNLA